MDYETPLYGRHVALGAKIVTFAGWKLPERYKTGVIEEHMAVRQRAGLFDISHMGAFALEGRGSAGCLQYLMTNDFSRLKAGRARYTLMCDESGGILDDMIVYKLDGDRYFIIVNASNRETDFEWMKSNIGGNGGVIFRDASDETAMIALQGPASAAILSKIAEGDIPPVRSGFDANLALSGVKCMAARTGYTGEDGFEIYCGPGDIAAIWDALLEAGSGDGLIPCGLGARDTLRLEAGMPLYGHEIDRTVTPFEAGLGFAVDLDKEAFIGKSALFRKTAPSRIRVGIKLTGRGIVRENCAVYKDGGEIGRTTSGTYCPCLGCSAAMALVGSGVQTGESVTVDIRGRMTEAEIAALPFYKRTR